MYPDSLFVHRLGSKEGTYEESKAHPPSKMAIPKEKKGDPMPPCLALGIKVWIDHHYWVRWVKRRDIPLDL